MEVKYVVKDFESQTYYAGQLGYKQIWEKEGYLSQLFDSIEDAIRFIEQENGKFQIEPVYVI